MLGLLVFLLGSALIVAGILVGSGPVWVAGAVCCALVVAASVWDLRQR
jgi:hypothetical protein